MDVEGIDLVALLEGGPVPQLPDDLDDLFTDDLLQFLNAPESDQPSSNVQPQELVAPTPAALVEPVATAPCVSSSSSQSEVATSPSLAQQPALPAPLACGTEASFGPLQVQQALAVPRLVTTAAAQQMWTAMLQAAYGAGPAAGACVDDAKARSLQAAGTSRQGSRDCSTDSSDTDHDDHEMVDSKSKTTGNKRKAPEVDWRQIDDPAERRRQRRLAKNRVTAARSRERKKAMWSELEEKLKNIENENAQLRAMLEQFARENASLKSQLLTITRAGAAVGGAAGVSQARAGKAMDPAVILPVFIVTLLVVCSLLPGDKACALLGSVLPLALLAGMLGGSKGGEAAHPCFESLFRLLHMLGTLITGSSKLLQRSFRRLCFDRHRYLGRSWMQRLAGMPVPVCDPGIASSSSTPAEDPPYLAFGKNPALAGPVSATVEKPGAPLLQAAIKLEPASSGLMGFGFRC
ncbi:hypothetical protein VOLCADRAFT_121646 [Volvox carteri f. nagariensis]|uniref:BZIP domain-containing protein n=1 Tax=Volvox carteri f. nagariensis TaxID=3068 RepID=D8UG37_VOLCA|nr:uncharacterized protein VOLCADRAFT_121646 [Volvox carteri f. nagariensis]EFJ41309.1 hypothetical protein VOLCADRAFT_121646 [Volvox carteri f. nagariensis]|eukprot:XP_002957643.1 hypothetical protein VOLCADRAFT_121646 [Volvox carteri f. nagariensis]